MDLVKFAPVFIANGYDDLDFMGEDILHEQDLVEMGLEDEKERKIIMDNVKENKTING